MSFWSRIFGESDKPTPKRELAARATAENPPHNDSVRATFGIKPDDPILCDQPVGERAYIMRLRCSQGHRLAGPRRGSMPGKCTDPKHHRLMIDLPGVPPPDEQCIVDCYDLVCEGGECSCSMYFDMYHPDAPPQPAPQGFTLQ